MTSTVAVPQANKKGNNLPSMLTRTHKIDHCQVWLTAGDSTSISEISSPSLIKRCTQFNELFHPRIHATEKQRWKQFAPNRFENSHAQLSSSFKPFGSRIWNPRESASEKYSLSLLKTTLVIRWGCPSNHITRGFILNTRWKYFTLSADKNYQNYNRSHPTNNSVKRFNQQDWIKNLYPRFLNQHPQSNEVVLQTIPTHNSSLWQTRKKKLHLRCLQNQLQ